MLTGWWREKVLPISAVEQVTVVGWRDQGNFLKVVALEVFRKVPFTHLGLHLLQEAAPEPLTHCLSSHPHTSIDVCISLLPRLELLKGKCVILESHLSL